MRNAVYPTMPSPLYFGNINNDGLQMLNSDISLYSTIQNCNSSDLHERKTSVCGNNFFHESQLCNDQLLGSFSPLSTIETPSSLNNYLSLQGLQPISDASTSNITASTASAMYDNTTIEQLYAQNLFSAQTNSLDNERKRPIIRSGIGPMLSEYATVEGSNKKKKNEEPAVGEEENRRPHGRYFVDKRLSERTRGKQPQSEEKRLLDQMKAKQLSEDTQQIRAKRSQKIGDRITTLQKLVSPFGKTDTASVLKEASGHIKILHNQIQMLTNPYFRPDHFLHYIHKHDLQDGTGEINNGLRKRGLCLVPVSFTHKIIKEAKP
ncbi:hypothetical protein MKX01_017141 [Papaver californicum]|nr:hypothetical protein MKX01_017141 [Papaver californicum]